MPSEVDINELARLIRNKRGNRGLRVVATEIGEISASTLSRIEQGKVPDLDTFIRLCKWLDISPDHFTNRDIVSPATNPRTPAIIAAHLRADRTLDPKTADALVTMIEMAFAAVESGQIQKQKGEHAPRVQNTSRKSSN